MDQTSVQCFKCKALVPESKLKDHLWRYHKVRLDETSGKSSFDDKPEAELLSEFGGQNQLSLREGSPHIQSRYYETHQRKYDMPLSAKFITLCIVAIIGLLVTSVFVYVTWNTMGLLFTSVGSGVKMIAQSLKNDFMGAIYGNSTGNATITDEITQLQQKIKEKQSEIDKLKNHTVVQPSPENFTYSTSDALRDVESFIDLWEGTVERVERMKFQQVHSYGWSDFRKKIKERVESIASAVDRMTFVNLISTDISACAQRINNSTAVTLEHFQNEIYQCKLYSDYKVRLRRDL